MSYGKGCFIRACLIVALIGERNAEGNADQITQIILISISLGLTFLYLLDLNQNRKLFMKNLRMEMSR